MEIRYRIPEQVKEDLEPLAKLNGYKSVTAFMRFVSYELSKKDLNQIKLKEEIKIE